MKYELLEAILGVVSGRDVFVSLPTGNSFILEVECRKHILKMMKMKPEDRGGTVREFMMTGSSVATCKNWCCHYCA